MLHLGAALGAAGTAASLLPAIAFGAQPGTGDETRTIRGRFEPGAPDWSYLPVNVPRGVREIEVAYRYDRPRYHRGPGNALDIGIFGEVQDALSAIGAADEEFSHARSAEDAPWMASYTQAAIPASRATCCGSWACTASSSPRPETG